MSKSTFLLTASPWKIGLVSKSRILLTDAPVGRESWDLPGCKGGNLAGSNRENTLVILEINFAEIQGIDVANNNY